MLGWLAGRYPTKQTNRLVSIVREMPTVEQWAQAWLAMRQGRISRARFDNIDAKLWEVMNEALSPEEIIKAGHQSAPKLFLNYRREDSAGDARSLFSRLAQNFGADNIFFDVNSISAGERFEAELRQALKRARKSAMDDNPAATEIDHT
jgi:hypothetical protein